MGNRCVPRVLTASGAGLWLLAFHSALRTPHSLARPRPVPWQSALVTPFPALLYKNSACRVLVTPFPALVYKNRCPQVSRSLFPVPGSPLLGVIHNGVCTSVHVKTIKFGSKSIKKATFSVKKASKRRAFRHAHLNIFGGHPIWR
jgi:hypothetical protein